jgi:hypothetical protein
MDQLTACDGFYLLPGDDGEEEYSVKLSYFNFPKRYAGGKKLDGSKIGEMYHVAFFKKTEDSLPELETTFEAIFIDPEEYVKTLIGLDIYGCFVKKTEYSHKWFNDYLKHAKNNVKKLRKEKQNEN